MSLASRRRADPGDAGGLLGLDRGDQIHDFVIDRPLGRGAFGAVYLAHQLSLDRAVALKLVIDKDAASLSESDATAGEARSLAQLNHPHIVRVFSESTDAELGVRLLCMQYVCGTTLHDATRRMSAPRNGAALTDLLDRLDRPATTFDVEALRRRERLSAADPADLVCLIGEPLAAALEHAHSKGVLHRDIKPANVLIDLYGRPLLADFNLAARRLEASVESDDQGEVPPVVGGTLAYMAPEHLEAFRPESDAPPREVDERSDVFSLGLVLWELMDGKNPLPVPSGAVARAELSSELRRLVRERRTVPLDAGPHDPHLVGVLKQCLADDPADRPQSAGDLEERLAGVRQSRFAIRVAPKDPLLKMSTRRPILWLVIAALLPQIGSSVLHIAYNAGGSIGQMTQKQTDAFLKVVLIYNIVMYPLCVGWIGRKAWHVVRELRRLRRGDLTQTDAEVSKARQRLVRLPRQVAYAAMAGWFPGAIAFPLMLGVVEWPVERRVWVDFIVSFLLAGSVAATYSCFATYGVTLRAIYPYFWLDRRRFHDRAGRELAALPDRLRRISMFASVVPLVGALTMVLVGPADGGTRGYRWLVAVLILFGTFGATFVGHITRRYIEQVYACRGTLDDASRPREGDSAN